MKTLIGGALATVLGLIGFSIWFKEFLLLLEGCIPVLLLLSGGMALYLGFDELKDIWKTKDSEKIDNDLVNNDSEKYKSEIEQLKNEIKDLKSKKV